MVYKATFTNSNGTMIADVATLTDDDDEDDDDDEFDVEEDTIVEEVEDYE